MTKLLFEMSDETLAEVVAGAGSVTYTFTAEQLEAMAACHPAELQRLRDEWAKAAEPTVQAYAQKFALAAIDPEVERRVQIRLTDERRAESERQADAWQAIHLQQSRQATQWAKIEARETAAARLAAEAKVAMTKAERMNVNDESALRQQVNQIANERDAIQAKYDALVSQLASAGGGYQSTPIINVTPRVMLEPMTKETTVIRDDNGLLLKAITTERLAT